MRELPILFTGPMVRAILAGNKLQTRRMKALEYFSRPENDPDGWWCARISDGYAYMVYKQSPHERAVRCPYGQPGDRLWVRETWAFGIHAMAARRDDEGPFVYAADGTTQGRLGDRWRPSIHMPRHASRLMLEITGVRVERLNDISEADARAEGCPFTWDGKQYEPPPPEVDSWQGYGRASFSLLWSQINGPDSWTTNPWVWVVEFEQVPHPKQHNDGGAVYE
ncbi:hypothetical protein RA224_21885 [Achromobacter aegrifaciens]|uniref:hypothetical protein n=1 Tax=Achromobacter aegrifaciens TaxID=1287736 RepID=UPI0027BB162E|nr:hypothetical protein [Achromobacter aegrifaciens]WLW59870.1 hypothetical protein RA224_21885 [Achromobacter aegrifaciens]